MRFIGVDLAWSPRNQSGLCAVEGARRRLGTAPHLLRAARLAACRGAVDPGAARRHVQRAAGRYEPDGERELRAGDQPLLRAVRGGLLPLEPHPHARPRAARLTRQLGLDTDPAFAPGDGSVRCAGELYPHTALVALFGLDRTLKYKAKRDRSVDSRHCAFRALADRTPPLDVRAAPRWDGLVATATTSPVGAGPVPRLQP